MINYNPFYKTLNKRHISKYRLMKDFLIPSSTIHRIHTGEYISLKSIEDLCHILHCKINDIVIIEK